MGIICCVNESKIIHFVKNDVPVITNLTADYQYREKKRKVDIQAWVILVGFMLEN